MTSRNCRPREVLSNRPTIWAASCSSTVLRGLRAIVCAPQVQSPGGARQLSRRHQLGKLRFRGRDGREKLLALERLLDELLDHPIVKSADNPAKITEVRHDNPTDLRPHRAHLLDEAH